MRGPPDEVPDWGRLVGYLPRDGGGWRTDVIHDEHLDRELRNDLRKE